MDWKLPPFTVELQFFAHAQIMDWGVHDLGLPDVWPVYGQGEGAKVCILDTGQPTHTDLIEGLTIAKDFTGSARGVQDLNGHSTHCHGIVGARNNDKGTVGVAPKCAFISGKVLGDNGSGSSAGIVSGLDWAVAQGADVVSLSLGSPYPDPGIKAAIERARMKAIVVCAAGNDGPGESFDYPGAWVGGIAASNQSRHIATFSSRNRYVAVAAPGEKVTSTFLNDQIATLSGTSMATPFVAGLAALAVSYCRRTHRPALTHEGFYAMLKATADDIGPPGPDEDSGAGIVNPGKFFARIAVVPPVVPPQPPVPTPSITVTVPGTYVLTT